MLRLIRGTLSRRGYVALLENLAALYDALEDELARHVDRPALRWLDVNGLRRSSRLAADIDTWRCADDPSPTLEPSAREYVRRLHAVAAESPDLLIAHAYVRYLGDLSGGQILQPIVAKMLGASGGRGLAFYDFSAVGDPSALKREFREQLDALDPSLADRIVAEAQDAFERHACLFRELEQSQSDADGSDGDRPDTSLRGTAR